MKKRKIGILLILFGLGIMLILYPFSHKPPKYGYRQVEFNDLEFPYKYPQAIGTVICLIGTVMIIFSFLPKEPKPKKEEK